MRLPALLILATALCGTAHVVSASPHGEMERMIAEALTERFPVAGRWRVNLADASSQAASSAANTSYKLAALSFNPSHRTFIATFGYQSPHGSDAYVRFTGAAMAVIDVPVLVRDIAAGEIVSSADLTSLEMPVERRTASLLSAPGLVVGQMARRALRAGTPLSANDVRAPLAVRRGELLTLVYRLPGLELTAQGRAQSDAAAGETVSVVNTASRRTVEAKALSSGVAVVEEPALNLQNTGK